MAGCLIIGFVRVACRVSVTHFTMIFESSVDRGMPSLTAARNGPDTRPLVLPRQPQSFLSFEPQALPTTAAVFDRGSYM